MEPEPSILDYLKLQLKRWLRRAAGPAEETGQPEPAEGTAEVAPAPVGSAPAPGGAEGLPFPAERTSRQVPWFSLLALLLALIGQRTFEPRPDRSAIVGTIFYLAAAGMILAASQREELSLASWTPDGAGVDVARQRQGPSLVPFSVSLLLALLAFLSFGSGQFKFVNLTLWLTAILTLCWSFWVPSGRKLLLEAKAFLFQLKWQFGIDRWGLLLLAVFAIAVFFRTYQLSAVPSQMISDHAEKLLDIQDVLHGKTGVYFPRNTGREFFQFYLTAAIILLLKTGIGFMSLKIGTVLAGLITLIYIYLIGNEMGGRRSALLAMAFAGIAYWPNVISRFGLRFPFYPVFYAAALYYFLRGLRARQRRDFIYAGIAMGLGLNGYSPYRVVVLVILVGFVLYLLHDQSRGYRRVASWGMLALLMVSFYICLPLLRYAIQHPEIVVERTLTRLTGAEHAIPGSVLSIFLSNFWRGITMFVWDDGETWVLSVIHRPALDLVAAALFCLGLVLLVIRYFRGRHWFDLFTIISIPLLMLPSILSLAFPAENPSLNRPGGVIVPAFLIVGLALDAFMRVLERGLSANAARGLAWGLAGLLFITSAAQNYDLVFRQYRASFDGGAWNTTEMGKLVSDFADLTGSVDTSWLVGFPYWADSRLVMINAGYPDRDNAIWPEHFGDTLSDPRPKMFLINITDTASVQALEALYPQGQLSQYHSKFPDRDFLVFLVPGTASTLIP